MRISMILLAWLSCLALVGSAAGAGAAPFSGGTFSLTLKGLEPLTIPIGSGVVGAGPSGTVSLTTTQAVVGTDVVLGITNSAPITQLQLVATGNATGTLVPGAGPMANALGLAGDPGLRVVGYAGSVTLLAIPITPIGVPGATFEAGGVGGSRIEFTGTGWTTGTAMLTVPVTTLNGGTQTPSVTTVAGTNGVVGGVGQVTFITPVLIRTNLAGDLPTVASLSFTFVPEPGSLLLLGSGIVALAALGRHRTRVM